MVLDVSWLLRASQPRPCRLPWRSVGTLGLSCRSLYNSRRCCDCRGGHRRLACLRACASCRDACRASGDFKPRAGRDAGVRTARRFPARSDFLDITTGGARPELWGIPSFSIAGLKFARRARCSMWCSRSRRDQSSLGYRARCAPGFGRALKSKAFRSDHMAAGLTCINNHSLQAAAFLISLRWRRFLQHVRVLFQFSVAVNVGTGRSLELVAMLTSAAKACCSGDCSSRCC